MLANLFSYPILIKYFLNLVCQLLLATSTKYSQHKIENLSGKIFGLYDDQFLLKLSMAVPEAFSPRSRLIISAFAEITV